MKFKALAATFAELERTSSQLQMVDILAKLFKRADAEEIDKICYLTLGNICAEYEEYKLGLGTKMVQSAIALAANKSVQEVSRVMRKVGDVGIVAEQVIDRGKEKFKKFFTTKGELSVKEVHAALMKIATASGSGSQEIKKKTLVLKDLTQRQQQTLSPSQLIAVLRKSN